MFHNFFRWNSRLAQILLFNFRKKIFVTIIQLLSTMFHDFFSAGIRDLGRFCCLILEKGFRDYRMQSFDIRIHSRHFDGCRMHLRSRKMVKNTTPTSKRMHLIQFNGTWCDSNVYYIILNLSLTATELFVNLTELHGNVKMTAFHIF